MKKKKTDEEYFRKISSRDNGTGLNSIGMKPNMIKDADIDEDLIEDKE